MLSKRISKLYYSEKEAARELGISVEQFRVLLLNHIVERREDLEHVRKTSFQASDLLILKHLSGLGSHAAAVGSTA